MSLRRKLPKSGDELVDGLVDDFQKNDDYSEAESSALSSVFPIVKSSQVRANAPRAEMPGTIRPSGLTAKKGNHSNIPRDIDSLTVETGRPIDSVYIYPSEPQAMSHRQRRTYKSGNRSTASGASSRMSGSVGEKSGESIGGILENLGLGAKLDGDDETQTESPSAHRPLVTPAIGQSRILQSRRPSRPTGKSSSAGPQVHLRASIVLFFLFGILYGAFQWIAMLKSSNSLTRKHFRKSKITKKQYRAFDEGEDRPMNIELLGRMSEPSEQAKKLAEVPKKDDYMDKPKLYLERDEVVTPLEELRTKGSEQDYKIPILKEENAPVDTLEKFDKADPEKYMSLSVQAGLAEIYTKDPSHKDTPLLWYIPRSGGGMVKNILSNCKDLVVASEVGATQRKEGEPVPKLEIVTIYDHKYVNVDTTTISGISEAKALGLAESGMAQLIVSPRLQAASGLFSSSHRGRTFAMIRHPIERAASMFYFLKSHKVPAIVDMSLDDYSKSKHVENNWMVRMLTDHMSGEVGEVEFELAKKVLKEKVLIGLLEQKEESLRRFEFYFGWKYTENTKKQTACRTRFLVGDYRTNESAKGKVKEGTQAWSLLIWQNKLDMKLYKYATLLFLQQGTELFADMP